MNMNEILDNIRVLGPMFAGAWAVTIIMTLLKPQRYFNSILLMISLFITILFVSGLFGERGAVFLLVCFLAAMLALFLVPVLLIINGIRMIRRESFSLAHILSLALGIAVGIGEAATVIYVLGLPGYYGLDNIAPWFMLVSFLIFYFSSLVLCFVIYAMFIQIMPHRPDFNYVIIHGCGLAGGEKLTKLLSDRVDKAIEIYNKSRIKPMIIPSGGQGGDEKLSEAQAMKNYLTAHGIPEDHIIPEDRSATTRENLAFSKAIIDAREGGKKTALVSSSFHVYRCLKLAEKEGLKCTGIGAHVAPYYWPSAIIREFIAVFLDRGFLVKALIGCMLFISPVLFLLLSS